MALKSSFFNSINGDRRYDARVFAEYFSSFIGNGIFPNPSSNLQVVEGGNMKTIIRSGKAWINGYFLINDSDYVLTHDNADGVLMRIDRIVLRLNYVARQIEIVIKKGAFASSPTAPTLQRDNDMYELAIADVLINNGATQITQANITDTRLNNALCGVVHGAVNQVDTTTIFNQYESWFDEFSVEKQQEFEQWIADLQTLLDGDVATNLLNRLIALEGRVDDLETDFNTHKGDNVTNAHLAKNIGIQDTSNLFTATNVEGALSELFTNVSNGKKLVGTAITDVDNSLVVPTNPTFQQLANLIRNISSGKKFATGTVTSGGSFTARDVNNQSNTIYAVSVTGLDFKAGTVILTKQDQKDLGATSNLVPKYNDKQIVTLSGNTVVYALGDTFNIQDNSFYLPVGQGNVLFHYVAFEE